VRIFVAAIVALAFDWAVFTIAPRATLGMTQPSASLSASPSPVAVSAPVTFTLELGAAMASAYHLQTGSVATVQFRRQPAGIDG
jgi:hypothetical protein